MTREEAKEILSDWNLCHYTPSREAAEVIISALDPLEIISALRPVSREQVEKVWKSEWIDNGERDPNGVPKTFAISCKRCGSSAGTSWMRFCPACGRAMTDEAVEIVMERMEALHENRD